MGEGVGVPLENAEKLGNRGSSKIMPTRNPGGSVGSIAHLLGVFIQLLLDLFL